MACSVAAAHTVARAATAAAEDFLHLVLVELAQLLQQVLRRRLALWLSLGAFHVCSSLGELLPPSSHPPSPPEVVVRKLDASGTGSDVTTLDVHICTTGAALRELCRHKVQQRYG